MTQRPAAPVPVAALLVSILLWLLAAIPGATGEPSSLTFLLFVSFACTSIGYLTPTVCRFEANAIVEVWFGIVVLMLAIAVWPVVGGIGGYPFGFAHSGIVFVFLGLNFATFALVLRHAQLGERACPIRRLVGLSLLGGLPGALIATASSRGRPFRGLGWRWCVALLVLNPSWFWTWLVLCGLPEPWRYVLTLFVMF